MKSRNLSASGVVRLSGHLQPQLVCNPVQLGHTQPYNMAHRTAIVLVEHLEGFGRTTTARHIHDFVGSQGSARGQFLTVCLWPNLGLAMVDLFACSMQLSFMVQVYSFVSCWIWEVHRKETGFRRIFSLQEPSLTA